MAYISCLPAELNSYVIVPNLSLSGLLFNLPPRITFRKVTAIQLEPYQRCTCRLDSCLSRMGHKSRNCISQSTITIMNNWQKKKCQKYLCIAKQMFDYFSVYQSRWMTERVINKYRNYGNWRPLIPITLYTLDKTWCYKHFYKQRFPCSFSLIPQICIFKMIHEDCYHSYSHSFFPHLYFHILGTY